MTGLLSARQRSLSIPTGSSTTAAMTRLLIPSGRSLRKTSPLRSAGGTRLASICGRRPAAHLSSRLLPRIELSLKAQLWRIRSVRSATVAPMLRRRCSAFCRVSGLAAISARISTLTTVVLERISTRSLLRFTPLIQSRSAMTLLSSPAPLGPWPTTKLSLTRSGPRTRSIVELPQAKQLLLVDTLRTSTIMAIRGTLQLPRQQSSYTLPCTSGTSNSLSPSMISHLRSSRTFCQISQPAHMPNRLQPTIRSCLPFESMPTGTWQLSKNTHLPVAVSQNNLIGTQDRSSPLTTSLGRMLHSLQRRIVGQALLDTRGASLLTTCHHRAAARPVPPRSSSASVLLQLQARRSMLLASFPNSEAGSRQTLRS